MRYNRYMKTIMLLLLMSIAFGQTTESLIPQKHEEQTPLVFNMGYLQSSSLLTETTVDAKEAPFKKALQAYSDESLLITPINNLIINFNKKKQSQKSLRQDTLNLWQQEGITISYVNDKSKFDFSQNIKENYNPLAWNERRNITIDQKVETRTFGLTQGIGQSIFAFNRKTTATTKPYLFNSISQTDSIKADIPLNFNKFQPTISYAHSKTTQDEKITAFNEQLQIKMPFADKWLYSGNFSENLQNDKITKINSYGLSFADQLKFHQNEKTIDGQSIQKQKNLQIKTLVFNQPLEYKHNYEQNLVKNQLNRTDSSYFNMPLKVGNIQTSILFSEDRTTSNGLLTAQKKTEQIILPLFGRESKYLYNSLTSQNKNNIVKNEDKTLILHLSKSIVYSMSDKNQYVNNSLTTRNMSEDITVPLDKILNGMNLSHNQTITLVAGKPQIDIKQQKVFIPLNLLASGASYQFITQDRSQNNQPFVNTQQHIFKMPFKNNRANLTYSMVEKENNTTQKFELSYPFAILGIPLNALYSHTILPSGETDSRFSTNIQIPITILGKEISNQNNLAFSSLGQDKITSSISIPFSYGPAKLTSTTISDPNVTTYTIETPIIPIANNTELGANLWAQNSKQKRTVNVGWKPSKQVQTSLVVSSNNIDPKESIVTTIDTSYNINQRTALNMRYLEKQQLDGAGDKTQSIFAFKHNSNDFAFQTTLMDIDGPQQDYEMFSNIGLSFGDNPFKLSFYTINYDEKKLIPLDKRTYALEARHESNTTGVSLKYQDDKSRLDALLALDIFWKIGNQTKFQIGYTDNGLDPTDIKKTAIRSGDVLDIGVSTVILDDVIFNVNMRQYESNNWFNIGIAGGELNKMGQLSILYQDGDFVARNTKIIPDSTLSIKYNKHWLNMGDFSLTLSQDVTEKENTEAKAELEIKF